MPKCRAIREFYWGGNRYTPHPTATLNPPSSLLQIWERRGYVEAVNAESPATASNTVEQAQPQQKRRGKSRKPELAVGLNA